MERKLLILFLIFVSVCIAQITATDLFKPTDNVMQIDSNNLNKSFADSSALFVMFYTQWCQHSKALAPEFVMAADALKAKNSTVRLAKVDCTEDNKLAYKFKVNGYPTLLLLKENLRAEYKGERDAKAMVDWLIKKMQPPTKKIDSSEAAKEFIASDEVTVLGFFAEAESAGSRALVEAAFEKLDLIPVGITNEKKLMKEFQLTKDTVMLFNQLSNQKLWFHGPFTVSDIKRFVINNKLPLLSEYSKEKASKIFEGDIEKHLLLFVNKKDKKSFEETTKELLQPATKFRGEVIFVYIDCSEDKHKKILRFFGLKKEDCPAVRFMAMDQDMAKYKPASASITASSVTSFIQDILSEKAKPHLISQDLPEDWNKRPVKVLVGTNFDKVARDKSKSVFVKFYAPWCQHSKKLAPTWQKLGEQFKNNGSVVIAKIDGSANELRDIKVYAFPTIKYFPAGSDEVIEYEGMHTLESLQYFVQSGGKLPTKFTVPAPPGFPKGARIEVSLSPVMYNGTDGKPVVVRQESDEEKQKNQDGSAEGKDTTKEAPKTEKTAASKTEGQTGEQKQADSSGQAARKTEL